MDDNQFDLLLSELKQADCKNPSEALLLMRSKGVFAIDALKALRQLFGIALAEAKTALSTSPAWADVTQGADALHQELIDAFENAEEYKEYEE